jgi:hypothetical protein
VLDRYPLLDGKGVVGGLWTPNDGQTNPVDTTMAYAKGARQRGVKIVENTEVTGIVVENGRAVGVRLLHDGAAGELRRTATVVLAAGMWSAELGRTVGLRLALQAAEHFYIVTEPMAGVPRDLPVLRVPDECAYYKEDAGKLLLGAFEPVAKPWALGGIPKDFCFDQLPDDFDHFEPVLRAAMDRVPALKHTGIATWFNGPESFTPDDRYLLGETAEVRDLFVACGFNSIGIQSSGGAGKVLAEWIRDRRAPIDLPGMDVRRMHPCQGTRAYLADRTTESLGLLYAMHWPWRQVETARGARRTALHDRLLAAGACMGELSRLGARQLVRRAGHGATLRLHLRPPRTGSRTRRPNAPRCATAWRCSTSPRWPSSSCRGATPAAAEPPGHRRRRPAAGARGLHAVAERAGWHRGRPDGHAAGRAALPGRDLGVVAHPRPGLAERAHRAR